MASCHNSLLLLLAFLVAFSLSFSSARILTTSDEQATTENSLFKKIPGVHSKPKLFKKPPCAPKFKLVPHHHPKLPEHKGIPGKVLFPKPKSKFDPPKFKIPPKTTVNVAANQGEKKSHVVNEGSKFSTGSPAAGLPNFGLPPFLSSPSIPYPDFIPLVPAIPSTPQSEGSKVKSTGHDQHPVAP